MENIIPSNEALKQESIMSDIPEWVIDLIKERKEVRDTLKKIEELLKPHLEAVAAVMDEMDVEELDTGAGKVVRVSAYKYKRVKGFKHILKYHPEIIEDYPDLITDVSVKAYVKIE